MLKAKKEEAKAAQAKIAPKKVGAGILKPQVGSSGETGSVKSRHGLMPAAAAKASFKKKAMHEPLVASSGSPKPQAGIGVGGGGSQKLHVGISVGDGSILKPLVGIGAAGGSPKPKVGIGVGGGDSQKLKIGIGVAGGTA